MIPFARWTFLDAIWKFLHLPVLKCSFSIILFKLSLGRVLVTCMSGRASVFSFGVGAGSSVVLHLKHGWSVWLLFYPLRLCLPYLFLVQTPFSELPSEFIFCCHFLFSSKFQNQTLDGPTLFSLFPHQLCQHLHLARLWALDNCVSLPSSVTTFCCRDPLEFHSL